MYTHVLARIEYKKKHKKLQEVILMDKAKSQSNNKY